MFHKCHYNPKLPTFEIILKFLDPQDQNIQFSKNIFQPTLNTFKF